MNVFIADDPPKPSVLRGILDLVLVFIPVAVILMTITSAVAFLAYPGAFTNSQIATSSAAIASGFAFLYQALKADHSNGSKVVLSATTITAFLFSGCLSGLIGANAGVTTKVVDRDDAFSQIMTKALDGGQVRTYTTAPSNVAKSLGASDKVLIFAPENTTRYALFTKQKIGVACRKLQTQWIGPVGYTLDPETGSVETFPVTAPELFCFHAAQANGASG